MLTLPLILVAVAALLVLVGLMEPLAERLRLPSTVLLALVGMVIGAGASFLLYTPLTQALNDVARVVVFLPLDSELFLFVFLPALLFHAALSLDVRRMIEDAAPIFLLAVVAVLVSTFAIGLALAPVSGESLMVCLLLGAIVATTDPVAVLAIFRDLGVPARLMRLIEGESLLNDAAAIALFAIILQAVTTKTPITLQDGLEVFALSGLGGLLIGYVGGTICLQMLRFTQRHPAALVTVSIGAPYIIFVLAEFVPAVSGVVAVVTAGATIATDGPIRIAPAAWQHLRNIWDQVAFWASSLIFVLASLLVPKLLDGVSIRDMISLAVLIVAALAARALVLFLLLPLLSGVGLSQRVGHREKAVILWGGLRGAITLVLALSITEHSAVARDSKQFIAVLATGFTLFTILVNGLTLRPLMRLLKLDQLSPFDAGLRDGVLALALGNVRAGVISAAQDYDIAPAIAREAARPYDVRITEATKRTSAIEEVSDRDRLTFGLIALADRERTILLQHFNEATVSPRVAQRLLARVQAMSEAARTDGRVGYRRAARKVLAYPFSFRIAQRLHRHTGLDRWLGSELSERFERLMVARIALQELMPFCDSRIRPILGARIAELLEEILAARRADIVRSLEALRLQYPEYANDLERRLLARIAIRREEHEYRNLAEEQLIGRELLFDLTSELRRETSAVDKSARLDLGLKKRELVAQFPLFKGLTPAQLDAVARLLKSRFAVPGERLIRKGDRGSTVYFVSSGAVEVAAGDTRIRLGRGDFIGELALLYNQRRSADVIALGYCQLLVLEGEAFRALLADNPEICAEVERVARGRMIEAGPDGATALAENAPLITPPRGRRRRRLWG